MYGYPLNWILVYPYLSGGSTMAGKVKEIISGLFQSAEEADNLHTTSAQKPANKKGQSMTKPTSYFSVRPHTILIPGRKENKGKKVEATDHFLFFEDEPFTIEYVPTERVGVRQKYIREANLKEISAILESGYDEKVSTIILKEKGYKELVKTLADSKILVLDFCQWVSEELAKIPAKTKEKKTGNIKESPSAEIRNLANLLASAAPNMTPDALVGYVRNILADEEKVSKALQVLEIADMTHGRDKAGYILFRTRTTKAKEAK